MKVMEKEDFRYTWVIPKSAWYIKTYLWVWDASVRDVTFCKLFWGYALIWVGVPFRVTLGFLRGVGGVLRRIKRELRSHRDTKQAVRERPAVSQPRPARITVSRATVGRTTRFTSWRIVDPTWDFGDGCIDGREDPTHRYDKPGTYVVTVVGRHRYEYSQDVRIERTVIVQEEPSVGVRFLEGVGNSVLRGRMITASVVHRVTHPPEPFVSVAKVTVVAARRVGLPGFMIASILSGVAAVAFGVYAAVTSADSWTSTVWSTTKWAATSAPVGVANWLVALILLTSCLLFYGAIIGGVFGALQEGLAKPAALGTRRGALGFGKVMLIGYKAVKSNTCPRVEVEEES